MRQVLAAALAAVFLSGCAVDQVNAPDAQIKAVRYHHDAPPSLTLFTMVNNETDRGAHSSLMINASERVIFDPAGTLKHEVLVEKGDVIYGVTPRVADFYTRAHARKTFHVVLRTIEVSPEIAEKAYELATKNGAVAPALCAMSTSSLLQKISGFDSINTTFFPQKLRADFAKLSGVTETALYEYDDADKTKALRAYVKEVQEAQNF